MEAVTIKTNLISNLSFKEVVASFFKDNTPDSAQVLFWKLFQCWATQDCSLKAELSDKEVALFFDQLINLVAAAYILHQANGALNQQEGNGHE